MSLDSTRLASMANAIRALSMDAVQAANSGHPGMPMGMADVATVLWSKYLKFDPSAPHWEDRDRFVLSAGHGSMLIYALLNLSASYALREDLQLQARLDNALDRDYQSIGGYGTPGRSAYLALRWSLR